MKKTILALALCASTLAVAVTYTRQNARVATVHMDVNYTAGSPTSIPVQAYMAVRLTNDADANDEVQASRQQVNFDLLDAALTSTNITASGKTVTYPQLAALIRQACLDRANAAGVQ
jgi:hypothetical protein